MRLRLPALLAAAALTAAACGGPPAPPAASTGPDLPQIAIILGGLADDGGFTSYGASAVQELIDSGRATGQVRESVLTPAEAEPILRQYAAEGYDLVIGWGLGFAESVFRIGTEAPDTRFVATGGPDVLERATPNVETWTYDAGQLGYLTGYVAGLAQLSPVAVVEGPQEPFLLAQWFGFSQGLREANPAAQELPPIYTGSFEDAQKAGQAAQTQIAAGARLIATGAEGYSPGVLAAVDEAGIAAVGLSAESGPRASAVNLGNVSLDLRPLLDGWLARVADGTFGSRSSVSTIDNGGLVFNPGGSVAAAPAFPADVEPAVADLAERIRSGAVTITPWTPGS